MRALKLWQWMLLTLVLILLTSLYLVMKLPLSFLFSDEMQEFGVTDLNGASLSGGDVWISQDSIPGLINLSYSWCPASGLGTWCVNVDSDLASFDAVVTPRSTQIHIVDANIQRLSTDLLGPAGGASFDGNIRGKVQSIKIASYECPLQHLEELSAQLELDSLQVMGAQIGNHQLIARSSGQSIELIINGESVEGTFSMAEGAYQAEGSLLASGGPIQALAQLSLMRPLGANRYGWEISGKIPC